MKNLKKISLLALSLGLVGTSFTVEASGVGSTAGSWGWDTVKNAAGNVGSYLGSGLGSLREYTTGRFGLAPAEEALLAAAILGGLYYRNEIKNWWNPAAPARRNIDPVRQRAEYVGGYSDASNKLLSQLDNSMRQYIVGKKGEQFSPEEQRFKAEDLLSQFHEGGLFEKTNPLIKQKINTLIELLPILYGIANKNVDEIPVKFRNKV